MLYLVFEIEDTMLKIVSAGTTVAGVAVDPSMSAAALKR